MEPDGVYLRWAAEVLTAAPAELRATAMGDDTLNEIAETHGGLRESIETTKRFVDQSDYLIQKQRQETPAD